MFRRSATLAAITLLLVASVVEGQPRRSRGRGPFGRRGMPDTLVFLASAPEIQEELGVTDEQQELLALLMLDLRDQRRGRFGGRFGGPRGGLERIRQQMEQLNQQTEKLVASILEPEQMVRLRELRLQREGLRALDRDEFVQALGLNDSQVAKIRELRAREGPRDRDRETGPDDSLDRDVRAVLSADQVKKWETMKGKRFNFPDGLSPFGPRRGNGPRREGGPSNPRRP